MAAEELFQKAQVTGVLALGRESAVVRVDPPCANCCDECVLAKGVRRLVTNDGADDIACERGLMVIKGPLTDEVGVEISYVAGCKIDPVADMKERASAFRREFE